MRFELSDEQIEFSGVVAELFESVASPSRLRNIWETDGRGDGRAWEALAELGALGIVVPERFGGSGAGHVELCLLLEAAGYAALPDPIVETAGIAAPLLLAWADDPTKAEWLPKIASGAARFSVCHEDGYAPWGADVDAVIVRAPRALHLITREHDQMQILKTQDPTRRLVRLDVSTLTGDTLLTDHQSALIAFEALGQAANAATLVGITRRILDMTLTYAVQRKQFGAAIGSFQAVKHRLADLAVALEAARVLTWYAAYALGEDLEDAPLAAMTAKASANEAAAFANRNGLQLHGGIGFTWEHDLHFWLMRGQALESAFGTTPRLRQAIGVAVRNAHADRHFSREARSS